MATETKEAKVKKAPRVKLDLVNKSAEYVTICQKECRSVVYDKKKIVERFNIHGSQADTLITLAKIADNAPSKQTR